MDYPLLTNQMPTRIKTVWRNKTFFLSSCFLLLGGGVFAATTYFDLLPAYRYWIALAYLAILGLLTVVSLALVPYRYAFHRYEINPTELGFQSGFIFRKITYVPISRIQHVETDQGPFLRRARLIEIVIHTAATDHHIAGLDLQEAEALRKHIIALVKVVQEDV